MIKEKERKEIEQSRRLLYEKKDRKRPEKEKSVDRERGFTECCGDVALYEDDRVNRP